MIRFLFKGLIRDRHRSLFPFIIVTAGVMVTVFMFCFMNGFMDEMIRTSAKLETGHVKVVTKGYKELSGQLPNDLALRGSDSLLSRLESEYPRLDWLARIKFGGLLDFPDEEGETRSQGPVFGFAFDLLGKDTKEPRYIDLNEALVRGRLPVSAGEMLMSEEFALNLGASVGDMATLISSTANGGMAIQNFTLVGTVRFGMQALDRNAMIADIEDIRYALDMEGKAGEILGIFPNLIYDEEEADRIASDFNSSVHEPSDDFSPVMLTLREQGGLDDLLDMVGVRMTIMLTIFIIVMSLVLWNAGLMSGIRRYGEIGVRLAMGESKIRVYLTLVSESLLIGITGTIAGMAAGLAVSYYFQEIGFDYSSMMRSSNMMIANVVRAKITPGSYVIGFIPGIGATFLGSLFSGIGIFRRRTAQLFKELEA